MPVSEKNKFLMDLLKNIGPTETYATNEERLDTGQLRIISKPIPPIQHITSLTYSGVYTTLVHKFALIVN
jgi:hypothetical protein